MMDTILRFFGYNKDEYAHESFDLYEAFERYNASYFDGMLGWVIVRWGERMGKHVGMCRMENDGSCEILINGDILQYRSVNDTKSTLLHEMIHAYLYVLGIEEEDDHGEVFMREAKRVGDREGCDITPYHSFHDEVRYLYGEVY